ncbi:DNA adenine methylase [Acidaminococcus sp.]|uniref:DNA adenine methylase n=1 Tax=Acidaminococcus sp. TaxID=1872103 RepID=UPI003522FA5F
MPYSYSPLRYPGGKTQLYKFILHAVELSQLKHVHYCEPFCGGAGLAMKLLMKDKVDAVILNDADTAIYSIWRAILDDIGPFLNKIQTVPITLQEWEKQHKIYEDLKNSNNYDFNLGFASFFLNRTNRSGIIEGGPIGGKKQLSRYKIDCRFNRSTLYNKIADINAKKNMITIYHLDALEFISKKLQNDKKINFIFFDPPYYNQGQNLYKNSLSKQYHSALANAIKKIDDQPWILTYDDTEDIKKLYADMQGWKYELFYSAQYKRKESELMYASSSLQIESYGNVTLLDM